MSMLKNLKKKDGKADPKKDTKKEKQPKAETKKQRQEEEEQTNEALVDLNYDEKDSGNVKNAKKVQSYKLEEKEIDTTNIVIEKKEEKKPINSWVVEQKDIQNVFRKDFDATKHQTEFESLTDLSLNKELEERAKKEAIEKKETPQIQEIGGIKYAPLAKDRMDVDSGLTFKKTENAEIFPQIMLTNVNTPVFTSTATKAAEFAPLEKSAQQLKEEELELKMKEKQNEIAVKSKASGWLGAKANEPKVPIPEFKVSAWVPKESGAGEVNAPTKFAPLTHTQQEKRFERPEQEFKFTNKKEQEERRLKREAELAQKGTTETKPKP